MHSDVDNDHYAERDEHVEASRIEDVPESYDGRKHKPGEHETNKEDRLGPHKRGRYFDQQEYGQQSRAKLSPCAPVVLTTERRLCMTYPVGQTPSEDLSCTVSWLSASSLWPGDGPSRASPRGSYQVSNP